MKIIENIKEIRINKGIPQKALADALSVDNAVISNIENGHNLPSMAVFFYICDYLGVTPCEFFEVENNDPATLSPIFEQIKKLKPEQVEVLQAMLNQMK